MINMVGPLVSYLSAYARQPARGPTMLAHLVALSAYVGLCWPILPAMWAQLGAMLAQLGLCWLILKAMWADLEADVGPC
jgi:hypothetical protein